MHTDNDCAAGTITRVPLTLDAGYDISIPYIQHQIFKDHNFHGCVFNCKIAPSKIFGRCMYVDVCNTVWGQRTACIQPGRLSAT